MTAVVTALDWYRHHNDRSEPVPTTPVGPDLAVGLSQDFRQDALDDLDLVALLEVDISFTLHPAVSTADKLIVGLETENLLRAGFATLANYTDGLRPEWRELAQA